MPQGFRAQRDKTPFDQLAQAFARTRLGGWLFVNVFPVIDRRLIPLTGGRLTVAVGQPVLLLHTRGTRSGQLRSSRGDWSMTTTTATKCSSSVRASGPSRSCCSNPRDGAGLADARGRRSDQNALYSSGQKWQRIR